MERSGYNEGGANDQGLVFFSPNGTFGQPPFYLHKMVSDTWEGHGIPVATASHLSVSAQRSDDGATVVLRVANMEMVPTHTTMTLASGPARGAWTIRNVTTLSPPVPGQIHASNTPGNPFAVVPVTTHPPSVGLGGGRVFNVSLPAYSASTIVFGRA